MYSKGLLILDDNGVKNTADFKYMYADWESYTFKHIPTGKKVSFRR
ncbi:hypothetical protein ACFO6R_13340 [Eubacterium multiforme]|uniref:Uncharacterized protein n=1 Tax=Eubacterium multiforme TaxID=83339 RepID=A0ABT9UXY5_9FIRM|nr:hypothetical protein [Eubacterium multiforme]MDQ0151172.1 hypothetical protein [Eubacterium multiforme]